MESSVASRLLARAHKLMASDKGPIATEAPLAALSASASQAAAAAAIVAAEGFAPEASRAGSLKRPRESTPTPPGAGADPATAAQTNLDLSPSKIQKLGLASRQSPPLLTGAAALEERRLGKAEESSLHPEMSENPRQTVLDALRSASQILAMSRTPDAFESGAVPPAPDTAATGEAAAPDNPGTQTQAQTQAQAQAQGAIQGSNVSAERAALTLAPAPAVMMAAASPQTATSPQGLGSGPQVVHSPAPMDIDRHNDNAGSYVAQPEAQMEEKTTAYSYPGIIPPSAPMGAPAALQRGMSLPMATSQQPDLAPLTPLSKKHKCPYCETEFTRHHNLKSHLLTHSQEKPYVCQTCQMRFRRLHDLKRHSKLHTGEKPHICPKCDRKFARGDALARHAKGAGGCAGRRASMGSFGAGDDGEEAGTHEGDDSVMSGILYDASGEAGLTEEERRRLSMSEIKQTPQDGFASHMHVRSYRPGGSRQGATGGITESPKPLSPGSALSNQPGHDPTVSSSINHQRSASMAAQMAQQLFGQRSADVASHHTGAAAAATTAASGPTTTAAAHSAAGSGSSANHQAAAAAAGAPHSRASSGPSHSQSGGSGDSSANLFASGESGVWTYIHSVDSKWEAVLKQVLERSTAMEASLRNAEGQIAYLDSRVGILTEEISVLRQQLRSEVDSRRPESEGSQEPPRPAAAPDKE